MISDERLKEISQCSDATTLFAYEQRQMARELLALRKAFSEPAAWVPMSQLSLLWKKKGVVVEADLSAIQRFNEVPLYCKPDLPE